MTRVRKNWEISLIIVTTLSLGCHRMEGQTFESWDKDTDGKLSSSEFQEGVGNDYSDVSYDDQTFYNETYRMIDENQDDRISKDEWNTSVEFNRDYDLDRDFSLYDEDRDNYLSHEEYLNAVSNTNLYSNWDLDANNSLDGNEIVNGIFLNWDANKDDFIDENEYNDFRKYYMGK